MHPSNPGHRWLPTANPPWWFLPISFTSQNPTPPNPSIQPQNILWFPLEQHNVLNQNFMNVYFNKIRYNLTCKLRSICHTSFQLWCPPSTLCSLRTEAVSLLHRKWLNINWPATPSYTRTTASPITDQQTYANTPRSTGQLDVPWTLD